MAMPLRMIYRNNFVIIASPVLMDRSGCHLAFVARNIPKKIQTLLKDCTFPPPDRLPYLSGRSAPPIATIDTALRESRRPNRIRSSRHRSNQRRCFRALDGTVRIEQRDRASDKRPAVPHLEGSSLR